MNKKILIVAAHPDDEVLGAGGVAKKHSKNGDEVYCLILGKGEMSRSDGSMENLAGLNYQSEEACRILGIKERFLLDFPDQRFDSVDFLEIVKEVEKYVEIVKPDMIYTHYANDLNEDHCRTFQAVATACRPCNPNCPKEIYSFEILSSTEWQLNEEGKFKPNIYVDIEREVGDKIRALEAYSSEIRDWPHSRSSEGVEILAKYRGLECGKKFAEAFKLVRSVNE